MVKKNNELIYNKKYKSYNKMNKVRNIKNCTINLNKN